MNTKSLVAFLILICATSIVIWEAFLWAPGTGWSETFRPLVTRSFAAIAVLFSYFLLRSCGDPYCTARTDKVIYMAVRAGAVAAAIWIVWITIMIVWIAIKGGFSSG